MDPFHFCSTQEWLSVPFHTHRHEPTNTGMNWTRETFPKVSEWDTQNLLAGVILVSLLWTITMWGRGSYHFQNSGTFAASLCAFSLLAPSWIEDRPPKAETWSWASFKPPITNFSGRAKQEAHAQLWVDEEPPWSLGVYIQGMPSAEPEAEPLGLSRISFLIFLVTGQSSNSDTIGKASHSPHRSV